MSYSPAATDLSRRRFTGLLAGATAAALAPWRDAGATLLDARGVRPLPQAGDARDERYWQGIREQFIMPLDLASLNAANLCPCSRGVIESLESLTRDVDADPSSYNRRKLSEGRERTRQTVAEFLGATPEEILLTRNTSEANNIVSSGLALGAGDAVVVFSDNHPSNHRAWTDKAARAGFAVEIVQQRNPHPGPEYYVEAFLRASTARTRLWALTHVTNSVGDLLPVAELCRAARERGILTLVDGAQTFGVLDVNMGEMQPDFFSGSGHKWPCAPRETGVLYVRQAVHDRLAPSVISLYGGAVGLSRTHEAFGQRDEPAMIAFGEALRFQVRVGRAAIATRARQLTEGLIEGLGAISGVRLWTHPDPDRSWSVVSFQPGGADPRRLADALYQADRIACATRGGDDRPGLRFSPHFYNLQSEIDRTVEAVAKYIKTALA